MRAFRAIRSTAVLLASVVALTGVSVTVLAASNQSPADVERGDSISFQTGTKDYDTDNDGLIEIDTLAQLYAVRWDLNGDSSPSDATAYGNAFEDAVPGMGCLNDTCTGYELTKDLDFDTTGDGLTNQPDPKVGTTGCVVDNIGNWPVDNDDCDYDTYWNGGAGWDPIGEEDGGYKAKFDGNGYSISNLFINSDAGKPKALFAEVSGGSTEISNLALVNVDVSSSVPDSSTENYGAAAVGRLLNGAKVSKVYATGSVKLTGSAQRSHAGGLVAYAEDPQGGQPAIENSYADVDAAVPDAGSSYAGGLAGRVFGATLKYNYSIGTPSGRSIGIGGLVAAGTLTSDSAGNYWDTEMSGISTIVDPGVAGEGKTSSDLKTPVAPGEKNADTYYDWSTDHWDFGDACQYPLLKIGSGGNPEDFGAQEVTFCLRFGDPTITIPDFVSGQAVPENVVLPEAELGGGVPPIKYSIKGFLPDGLRFDSSTRTISGRPTEFGEFEVTYVATDAADNNNVVEIKFTITVTESTIPDNAYITKIAPVFRSVAVSPGETVVLRTLLYGLQGEVDADLDTDAVSFSWSYAAAGSEDSNAISGNDAAVPFTVPSNPGTYTAKATLTNDYCASSTPNDWKASDCTAEFEVVVKRPSASAAEDAVPVNPPASAIPSILTDSDGNQYEVFTPEQGGTFAGEGYWVQADPGAVPNGEVVGIRMAVGDDADNSEMTAHRYTLGGSTYEIAAVDADGASVNGYVLEPNGLEVCVPLPVHLRGNVADASVVAHADDSLAILTSTVRINADGLLVCGTLSHLPATVAAGIEGSPKAPEAADDPTAPATGGAAPASGTPLLLLALGILVGVIGVATIVAARRLTAFGKRRGG